jgi:catechol 2,3-dioxygenase-like lactoylglutathione lyase family enzyme
MISSLSHISIYVLNQDEAIDFYTNKLGFEIRTDHTMEGGFRWITVGPKEQKGLEIVLMPVQAGFHLDEETASTVRSLIKKGVFGAGVFETKDCRKTYEEYKARGVEFMSPPEERFYGIEAIFKDNSGNWFSMTQPLNKK